MTRALSILTLAFALILGACGGGSSSGNSAAQDEVQVNDFRLVEAPNGERQVMGTLRNMTSEDIENAQVQVALFDADNVQIEEMNVPVKNIPAEGEVEFKHPLDTDADVAGAQVSSVLVL